MEGSWKVFWDVEKRKKKDRERARRGTWEYKEEEEKEEQESEGAPDGTLKMYENLKKKNE